MLPAANDRSPSRRRILLGAAASLLARLRAEPAASGLLELDRVWPEVGAAPAFEQRYRVDAAILLLGVPVLHRSGIGEGYLSFAEIGEPEGRRLALEFAAASDPARAHGLDRAGWIREGVLERSNAPRHTAVLGVMNDSPEHSEQEALQALHAAPGEGRFVAIDSAGAPGHTRSRVARFSLPAGRLLFDRLQQAARRILCGQPAECRESSWPAEPGGAAPSTFLYALYRSLQAGGPTDSTYVWNEDCYSLRLTPEPSAGAPVRRFNGLLENRTKAGSRPLRLAIWAVPGQALPMPLRIEFQPRSFLRLTLETVSRAPGNTKEIR